MTPPTLAPDPGDLTIRTTPGPDCCTVAVTGDVDARSGPVLADRLQDVVEQSELPVVELDLRGVTFLNAAGLTALVVTDRAATAAGRLLRLRCGTNRVVLRPLEITGLSSVLDVVDGPAR